MEGFACCVLVGLTLTRRLLRMLVMIMMLLMIVMVMMSSISAIEHHRQPWMECGKS